MMTKALSTGIETQHVTQLVIAIPLKIFATTCHCVKRSKKVLWTALGFSVSTHKVRMRASYTQPTNNDGHHTKNGIEN